MCMRVIVRLILIQTPEFDTRSLQNAMCLFLYVFLRMYVYVCLRISMYVCFYVCLCIYCMCRCVCVIVFLCFLRMCLCVRVCVYVCVLKIYSTHPKAGFDTRSFQCEVFYIFICACSCVCISGGARGVIVIVVGNEHGDPSSNRAIAGVG